ncbi:MAG: hypothetical protein HY329_11175 [Chloroflexi bacterium]|nr:hypothetical protein [Chloroflexota bacterium]
MAQKFSQWLSTLAIITMMMTLVPLGSAAPAEAISGTNVRDENVLRTTGVSRVTYDTGATGGTAGALTNNGDAEGYASETNETNSVAELDRGNTIGDTFANATVGARNAGGDLSDSQILRIRGSFFKNATNADLPSGGAATITDVYIMARDRSTGAFAYVNVRRGSGTWDSGTAVLGAASNDGIAVFCRNSSGGRRWATNNGVGGTGGTAQVDQFDRPAIEAGATGDQDTPPINCGADERPLLSSVQFSSDITGTGGYGVSGTAGETLNISVMFAFPTPETEGPIDFYTAVEDADAYADGFDFYASVAMGDRPTVTGAPFTGVSTSNATAGTAMQIFVSIEDKDTEADIRAAIATIMNASGGYVQLIFFHQVDKAYGTPGTSGTGTSISVSDFEDRYQVYDGVANRYRPNKPTDTGTITTEFGVLDIGSSTFTTSGDRLTVTFAFTPNAAAAGSMRFFAIGVDRELQPSNTLQGTSFNVAGGG